MPNRSSDIGGLRRAVAGSKLTSATTTMAKAAPPLATGADADGERPASPAVARALGILEMLVASDQPLTLTAIADEAGIPLATCGAIMKTLEQTGFAQRRIVGRSHLWQPTLHLFTLGNRLMQRYDLVSVSQPALRRLADAASMPAHVGMLEGTTIVYIAKAATPGFVQFNTYPGKTAPFNLTALGRAIAAYLPPRELSNVIDHLSTGAGPKSQRTDSTSFLTQLAQIRVDGYAIEDEEEEANISCVAAPIFDASGAVVASVGVTGFAQEVVGERLDGNIAAVVEAGREISLTLGHRPRPVTAAS